jgi:hypothetical protein
LNPVIASSHRVFSFSPASPQEIRMSDKRPSGADVGSKLSSAAGELVSVRVSVPPRQLEKLLESLALLSFPVNPQIYHGVPTVVEFPAYSDGLSEVRDTLRAYGFDPGSVSVDSMLAAIGAA